MESDRSAKLARLTQLEQQLLKKIGRFESLVWLVTEGVEVANIAVFVAETIKVAEKVSLLRKDLEI